MREMDGILFKKRFRCNTLLSHSPLVIVAVWLCSVFGMLVVVGLSFLWRN